MDYAEARRAAEVERAAVMARIKSLGDEQARRLESELPDGLHVEWCSDALTEPRDSK